MMAGESGGRCELAGRVMKRRAYSSFTVLEIVATSINGACFSGPLTVSAVLQGAGGVGQTEGVEKCPREVYDFVKGNLRLGDVVKLVGSFEGISEEDVLLPGAGMPSSRKLQFSVCDAALLEKWDASAHGDLYYSKPGTDLADVQKSDELSAASVVFSRLPQLILQCPDAFVARLL
eukprot:2650628-Rhodomonas_salina.1